MSFATASNLNVPRFQLSLNSDDPDIVKLGLRQFLHKILQEQNVENVFGYDGVEILLGPNFYNTLHPKFPVTTTGLLRAYCDASPQIEEFFVLWGLPNYGSDPELCGLHMKCFAAILFCCAEQVQLCRYIIHRIFSSCLELLLRQLDMKDPFVVQMTLALIITSYRIQKTVPDELISSILLGISSKSLIFHVSRYNDTVGLVETRSLLALFMFLLVDNHADPSCAVKIFKDEAGLKNLFRDLVDASDRAVQILLNGMIYLVSTNYLVKDYMNKFVSRMVLGKVADLSISTCKEKSALADSFLLEISRILAKMITECTSQSKQVIKNVSNCANDMLDSMKPTLNDIHGQVQLILIKARPTYLKKCVQSLKLPSWDPQESSEYINTLEHLNFLLIESVPDESAMAHFHDLVNQTTAFSVKKLGEMCFAAVEGMLPAGFTKKELCKLIVHENNMLQKLGVSIVHGILKRIEHAFANVLNSHRSTMESIMFESLSELLPDFSFLYNSRSSLLSTLSNFFHPVAMTTLTSEDNCGGTDIQLNLDGNEYESSFLSVETLNGATSASNEFTEAVSKQREHNAFSSIQIYLQCLSALCRIVPASISRLKCDILKLIDDFLAVASTVPTEAPLSVVHEVIINEVIDFLNSFDGSHLCAWFGSEEEAGKLLNAIIVSDDWRSSVKKSSFFRLLSISTMSLNPKVKEKMMECIMKILLRSGLFGEHPYEKIEMVHEAAAWIKNGASSCCLLDIIIRLGFHFAPSVSMFFHNAGATNVNEYMSYTMQASLLLCTGNFQPFKNFLPKFIQSYIDGLTSGIATIPGNKSMEQSAIFFDKFNCGFRKELEQLTQSTILDSLTSSRNFNFACNLPLPLITLKAPLSSSVIMTVLSGLSTTTVPNEPCAFSTNEVSWTDHFVSKLNYCLFNTKKIFCSSRDKTKLENGQPCREELFCFAQDNWKILVLKGFNVKDFKPSNEFFYWMDSQFDSFNWNGTMLWDLSSNFMFCLNWLFLINGYLAKRLKSESDMEKSKCSICLSLADKVGDVTLMLLNKLLQHDDALFPVLSCTLLEMAISDETAFGMLSRNIFSTVLESTFDGLSNMRKFKVEIDGIVELLANTTLVQAAMRDKSFYRLLSAVSKVINDENEKVMCQARQKLLHAYASLKILMTSTTMELSSNNTQSLGSCVIVDDPVFRIGEFSPLQDIEVLMSSIMSKNPIKINRRTAVNTLFLPVVTELNNGSWTFFDFYGLASNHSETFASSKLPYRLHCNDTDRSITATGNEMYITRMEILRHTLLLDQVCGIYESVLTHLDITKLEKRLKELTTEIKDDLCVHIMNTLIGILKQEKCIQGVFLLHVLHCDMEQGGKHVLDGSLFIHAGIILCKYSASSLSGEFMTDIGNYCFNLLKENQSIPSRKYVLMEHIAELIISHSVFINCSEYQTFWSVIDKLIKTTLWSDITDNHMLSILLHLVKSLYLVNEFNPAAMPSIEGSLNPLKMLRLLIAHQLFGESLAHCCGSTISDHESPEEHMENAILRRPPYPIILRLVLVLVKVVERCKFDQKSVNATLVKLQKHLMLYYKGSLEESDRIIFRLLCMLYGCHKIGTPIHNLQPVRVSTVSNTSGLWLYSYVKPFLVYNTLANFPTWRSLSAQPFAWEVVTDHERESFSNDHYRNSSKFCGNARHVQENMINHPFASIDLQCEYDALRYDPAHLIPVTLSMLMRNAVSIRHLANCGALSMLFASLSSDCSSMRTYALASLSMVWNLINEQDGERDPSFRERPQLLHLISFLRNSIEPMSSKILQQTGSSLAIRTSIPQLEIDGAVLRLPLTTAIFLARSALHIMQPKHELYIPTNLYLLGRPICDVRDVPLYDLLVQNADSETERSERLSVLRCIRDGLRGRQDHLNLCRKHAYSKFMLLFPLFSTDHRAGHAILDIFDMACRYRDSARYLLEKCQFGTWLQKFIPSPVGRNFKVQTDSAATTVFLPHSMWLLRRSLCAIFLLNCENIAVGQLECFTAVNMIMNSTMARVQDIAEDADYFSSLTSLCWEAAIIQLNMTGNSSSHNIQSSLSNLLNWRILQDLSLSLYQCMCIKNRCYDSFIILAILISISSSIVPISEKWIGVFRNLIQDMIRLLVTGKSIDTGSTKRKSYVIDPTLLQSSISCGETLELADFGVVAMFHGVVNDNGNLPPGLSFADRVDLVWQFLSQRNFSNCNLKIENLGIKFVCYQFGACLHKQISSVTMKPCRSEAIAWCLTVWNTLFRSVIDHGGDDDRSISCNGISCSFSSILNLFISGKAMEVEGVPDCMITSMLMLKYLVSVGGCILEESTVLQEFPIVMALRTTLVQHIPTQRTFANYVSACESALRLVQTVTSLEMKINAVSFVDGARWIRAPLDELRKLAGTLVDVEIPKDDGNVVEIKKLTDPENSFLSTPPRIMKKRVRERSACKDFVKLRKKSRWQPMGRLASLLYPR